MKRYDYLIEKQTRRYNKGTTLSKEEEEEIQKLRPNVLTPISMLFEILFETVKTNQETRKSRARSGGLFNQSGGAVEVARSPSSPSSTPKDAEARRLSELEESLLPLLTKIIVYIEQNKKTEKKKENEPGEETYPDIGTSAKNSAILVIRKIKKWWNDLIQGGSSDLSSQINLRKAIPQLADNAGDMNKINEMADRVVDVVHNPLKRIEKVLSNDVKDIASSSVEGIMNALSLIPGIGTTLQLWRLLQNVIVIMSKSVTTMADTKVIGTDLKRSVQDVKGEIEALASNPTALAGKLASSAGLPDPNAMAQQLASNPTALAGKLASATGLPDPNAMAQQLTSNPGALAGKLASAAGLPDPSAMAQQLTSNPGALAGKLASAAGLPDPSAMAQQLTSNPGALAGKLASAAGLPDPSAMAQQLTSNPGALAGKLASAAGLPDPSAMAQQLTSNPTALAGKLASAAGLPDPNAMAQQLTSNPTALAGKLASAAGLPDPSAMAQQLTSNPGALAGKLASAAGLPDPSAMMAKAAKSKFKMGGSNSSSGGYKPNRLRSIKKYKQEYKQSIRDIRRTKKRIIKYFNNII
jgi:hypothetical protein